MKEEEVKPLNERTDVSLPDIEEMEQRLESQVIESIVGAESLCVWYACTDVCPPGG